MNPEFIHVAGKDNAVANMLSQARYDDEETMIDDEEDVSTNFYFMALGSWEEKYYVTSRELFSEYLDEGGCLHIGMYLKALERQRGWTYQELKSNLKKNLWLFFSRRIYVEASKTKRWNIATYCM